MKTALTLVSLMMLLSPAMAEDAKPMGDQKPAMTTPATTPPAAPVAAHPTMPPAHANHAKKTSIKKPKKTIKKP